LSLSFRLLPWEYAIRNLFRRPLRTFLTFAGLTTVIVLVFVVVGFIRGLERSLAVTGDDQTAIIFSLGMGENLEYSSIPMRTNDLVPASVPGIQERFGQKYVSPELYLGTIVRVGREQAGMGGSLEPGLSALGSPAMGLVRGVTRSALLVRRQVEIEEGDWPKTGEVMIGRMAATKFGATQEEASIGRSITFEGRSWKISGIFSAGGSAFESEAWCRLDELQQAMKRQDLSIVAVTLRPKLSGTDLAEALKLQRKSQTRTWKGSSADAVGEAKLIKIENDLVHLEKPGGQIRVIRLGSLSRRDQQFVRELLVARQDHFADLDLFCKERLDLELQTMQETAYYASLQEHYGPVRWLAWLVVLLVSGAGVFAGLNTMYGSVVGRIPELSMLQTIGFARRAIVVSLIQEGVLLAAAASLLAALVALVLINGAPVRFTMGAFSLRIDSMAVLIGCGVGLSLGFFGAIHPAIRALRMPIVDGLKAV
jgi:ABC-type antimicrobial peptide transport system permease subunit